MAYQSTNDRNAAANHPLLTRLEHSLLSTIILGYEPLHALYADARREKGASKEAIIEALVILVDREYVKPYYYRSGYEAVDTLTVQDLMDHLHGVDESEWGEFPESGGEYFFDITEQGKVEEAKREYDDYYPIVQEGEIREPSTAFEGGISIRKIFRNRDTGDVFESHSIYDRNNIKVHGPHN